MKRLLMPLVGFIFLGPLAHADDLGTAFQRARDMLRDLKPPSSVRSERAREERSSGRSPASDSRPPSAGSTAEVARRQERERIESNLRFIERGLAQASTAPRAVRPTQAEFQDQETARRLAQLDHLMNAQTPSDSHEALRRSREIRTDALRNAQAILDATSRGRRPPFEALLNLYRYERPVAYGLLPDGKRCALVLGMALGLEPESAEDSLRALSAEIDRQTGALNPVRGSDVSKRYYVAAQKLADRLKREWGAPVALRGSDARRYLEGKKGVVFLQDAYFRGWPRGGDHIGLWNSTQLADPATTPWERAQVVWFWELGQ